MAIDDNNNNNNNKALLRMLDKKKPWLTLKKRPTFWLSTITISAKVILDNTNEKVLIHM